jgi:hypothetical protein
MIWVGVSGATPAAAAGRASNNELAVQPFSGGAALAVTANPEKTITRTNIVMTAKVHDLFAFASPLNNMIHSNGSYSFGSFINLFGEWMN